MEQEKREQRDGWSEADSIFQYHDRQISTVDFPPLASFPPVFLFLVSRLDVVRRFVRPVDLIVSG